MEPLSLSWLPDSSLVLLAQQRIRVPIGIMIGVSFAGLSLAGFGGKVFRECDDTSNNLSPELLRLIGGVLFVVGLIVAAAPWVILMILMYGPAPATMVIPG